MYKHIKSILSNITFKIITDFIKDNIVSIFPLLISSGGYMLVGNTIAAWLCICLGLLIGIYGIRNFIINLKKDMINDIFTIRNKLIICEDVTVHGQYLKDQEKVAISLSYFIYNYSFNLIEACFNKKTLYQIRILGDSNNQIVYNEEKPNYPNLPYYLPLVFNRTITTYQIILPVKEQMTIEINGNLTLDYNAVNNKLDCYCVEKIIRGTFKLSKTTNDQNEPVIIVQPVLPTN